MIPPCPDCFYIPIDTSKSFSNYNQKTRYIIEKLESRTISRLEYTRCIFIYGYFTPLFINETVILIVTGQYVHNHILSLVFLSKIGLDLAVLALFLHFHKTTLLKTKI